MRRKAHTWAACCAEINIEHPRIPCTVLIASQLGDRELTTLTARSSQKPQRSVYDKGQIDSKITVPEPSKAGLHIVVLR